MVDTTLLELKLMGHFGNGGMILEASSTIDDHHQFKFQEPNGALLVPLAKKYQGVEGLYHTKTSFLKPQYK